MASAEVVIAVPATTAMPLRPELADTDAELARGLQVVVPPPQTWLLGNVQPSHGSSAGIC